MVAITCQISSPGFSCTLLARSWVGDVRFHAHIPKQLRPGAIGTGLAVACPFQTVS